MKSKRVKGTFYVQTSKIDVAGHTPPYVTLSELQAMYADGWDIGNHTVNHVSLGTADLATCTSEIGGAITALTNLGLPRAAYHIAYPSSSYSTTSDQAMTNLGMLTGRKTVAGTGFVTDPPAAGNYRIDSVKELGSGTYVINVIERLKYAKANGLIAWLVGHQFTTDAEDAYTWFSWKLQSVVDYIVAENLPPLTVTDWYAAQSGPVTITRS